MVTKGCAALPCAAGAPTSILITVSSLTLIACCMVLRKGQSSKANPTQLPPGKADLSLSSGPWPCLPPFWTGVNAVFFTNLQERKGLPFSLLSERGNRYTADLGLNTGAMRYPCAPNHHAALLQQPVKPTATIHPTWRGPRTGAISFTLRLCSLPNPPSGRAKTKSTTGWMTRII